MAESHQRRQALTIGAGVLLIGGMLAGAYYAKLVADGRTALASADPDEIPIRVAVTQVTTGELPVHLVVRGFLEGVAEVRVVAEVAGRIATRNADDGDDVHAGQSLYQVDETFHRLALEQAQANLGVARAEHDQAQAAIEAAAAHIELVQARRRNAQIEFDRIDELFRAEQAPKIEFDRAETTLHRGIAGVREAQAALRQTTQQRASAEAAIALAQARLAQTAETLDRCHVRSPLAGRVDRMLVEAGEYVVPGQPVADVIRLDRLKLFIEVSGRELALLGDDASAVIVPDSHPQTQYAATVHHVAPRCDPVSRKFRLELRMDNPSGVLLSGTFAECRLTSSRSRRVTVIPAAAIVRLHGRDYCRVLATQDGHLRAHLQPVATRPIPDLVHSVQLIDGLALGDRVVTESQAELRDGALVVVLPTSD